MLGISVSWDHPAARNGQPCNAAAEKGTRDDVEQVMLLHQQGREGDQNASAKHEAPDAAIE